VGHPLKTLKFQRTSIDFESVGWGFESLVACHLIFWRTFYCTTSKITIQRSNLPFSTVWFAILIYTKKDTSQGVFSFYRFCLFLAAFSANANAIAITENIAKIIQNIFLGCFISSLGLILLLSIFLP